MPRIKKVIDDSPKPLTPDDIARYYELKEVITKPLLDELQGLEIRFKGELPVGNYPSKNGFVVKRWEQMSTFMKDKFLADKNPDDNPELFEPVLDVELAASALSFTEHPECYTIEPALGAIKETLNDAEKRAYFKQAQYLKIELKKAEPVAVMAVPNFDEEDPDNA